MARVGKKFGMTKHDTFGLQTNFGPEWKALEKTFDKAGKRAPFMMKSVLGLSLTPIKREVKKQLPKRGRGWHGKYGVESGALKNSVDKVVRPVKKRDSYVWGGVGVKEGKFPVFKGRQKKNKKFKSGRGLGFSARKSGKRSKPKQVHIPWNIDHLIEFGFVHKKSGKFIPPHPFLRRGRDKALPTVKKVMEEQTKKKIMNFFLKRKKTTKAPFR